MRERLNRHVNAVQVVRFPFAHDTPGLADGVVAYTPTPGDLLLEAWFDIHQAWDGASPSVDIGTFVGMATGLYAWGSSVLPLDLALAGNDGAGAGMLLGNQSSSLSSATIPWIGLSDLQTDPIPAVPTQVGLTLSDSHTPPWRPQVLFTAAHPLKVAVSRDGTAGGADPGATQGSATGYLLIAPA